MGWIIFVAFLQTATIICIAPFIQGIIKKTKARMQNRIGSSVLQPYYDLIKFMKKDAVLSLHSSWLSVATPYIVFVSIVTAGLFIPTYITNNGLSFMGDIILVVYLFGIARFFTAFSALDAGGSFGGMGSSREIALSAIAEPALLLAVFAVLLSSGTTKLPDLIASLTSDGWSWFSPSYGLAFFAMLIVLIAETGRIPVDNPDTHLELTMVHEGMLLEYSGRYLGLMMWAAQMKQLLLLSLFINLFFPWGIAASGNVSQIVLSFLLYVAKLVALGMLLAFIETMYAKIRLFKVPKLLGSSMILSLMAILLRVFE
ncbi:formate hydrogenlyase subunit 4 [Anoxybacillus tepidamans]|uniref:Formate hydrogenlyase subunit 4 n=1 Tax=Anoxybacteroides tepidamans TaxID=265948 RepID=A0A7W8IMC1_9BACL|nr:NADH-quinone oxidoreductase subunit H [Anoxybacillus tepidamans]MBB5323125.1 formate hydrogenlyase subunit 4 [Anoxybacillus tepidamans]